MSKAERDYRYNSSPKGQERSRRYNRSDKGWERRRRYEKTAKAIRRNIESAKSRGHRTIYLEDALEEREAYEASGSSLSFGEWLRKYRPLPPLPPIRMGL